MPLNFRQLVRRCHRWLSLRRCFWLAWLLALLLPGIWGTGGRVAADVPSAVDLLYFRGEGSDGAAYLEWETGTESDTAGFRLERGTSADGPFDTLDEIGFITASGSVSAGAYYEATDETALNGQTYWYRLVEVTLANSVGNRWTVRVSVEAEPTSQIIGGGGGTTVATSTIVPTSTTVPTATSQAAMTGTPATTPPRTPQSTEAAATNTPPPAATRPPTRTPLPAATATSASSQVAVTTRTFTFTATPEQETTRQEAQGQPATPIVVQAGAAAATPSASPYPVSGAEEDATGEAAVIGANPAAAAAQDDTPLLGGHTVGSGDAGTTEGETAPVQQQGRSSTLLLWLGFLAALFIFVGGIAFSIFLSSRRRDDDLP